jgi:hypothetical protein
MLLVSSDIEDLIYQMKTMLFLHRKSGLTKKQLKRLQPLLHNI